MQIIVVTRDGKRAIYDADRFGKISDLKAIIGRNLGVPMGFSRLMHKGRLLTNDCLLEDAGIKRMSTLELFWQPVVLTLREFREKELECELNEMKARSQKTDGDKKKRKKILSDADAEGIPGGSGSSFMEEESQELLHRRSEILTVGSTHTIQMQSYQMQAIHNRNHQASADDSVDAETQSITSDDLEYLAVYRRHSRMSESKKDIALNQSQTEFKLNMPDYQEDADNESDIGQAASYDTSSTEANSTPTPHDDSLADLEELLHHRQMVLREVELLKLGHDADLPNQGYLPVAALSSSSTISLNRASSKDLKNSSGTGSSYDLHK